jgi:hypothetical protein
MILQNLLPCTCCNISKLTQKIQSYGMLSKEETSSARCPQCLQRWVLVVHDDFGEVADMQRNGNDVDVANLRRVFSVERGFQFAELARQKSSNILHALSNWQYLTALFGHNLGI